jgi:hypothetical protein
MEEKPMSINNLGFDASNISFGLSPDWLNLTINPNDFEIAPPVQLPRVLSQTVAAGLIVPQGTMVDVVVAPSQDIPVDVFAGVPASLKGKTVKQVLPALTAAVQGVLAKDVPVASLTDADKTTLVTGLSAIGVTFTTAQVDQALVNTLRSAALFL